MIKFYNPLGKVCMTSDYFAGLVGAAAQSCYGVCGMATGGTSDSLKTDRARHQLSPTRVCASRKRTASW